MPRLRLSRAVITGAAALALVAGGTAAGAAVAASPTDSSGVIHGCYTDADINGSHVLVLQDGGTTCPKGTTAISWGTTGATGPQGPQGPTGNTGPQGPIGLTGPSGATGATGAQGPIGNTGPAGASGTNGTNGAPGAGATVGTEPDGTNCTYGGANVTDGSGTTAYACNGAPGLQGPPGPAGTGTSTAGPGGLGVTVVNVTSVGDQDVVAICPADHPYLLSGGGYDVSSPFLPSGLGYPVINGVSPNSAQFDADAVFGGAEQAQTSPVLADGNGWVVLPTNPDDTFDSYAVCAQ